MSLNADELCRWLACFGFDLAATLVAETTAGQRERAIVGQWLKDLARRGPGCGFDRPNFCQHSVSPIISEDDIFVEDKSYHDGSGLYQMLYPRFTIGRVRYLEGIFKEIYHKKLFMLYRSRAWAFFDDARLFKSQEEWPYFPADDAVFPVIQFHDIIGPRRPYDWSRHLEVRGLFSPKIEIRDLSNAITQAKV
ncbi:hypothetical protein GGS24DRAFT_506816 [Hypoxylon argillaceum]|nr:hypothetical protein GGS24DRAFT_506816 [Hypoxylon argillaceum]